ncbi:hypothetical protein [Cysteiniphilum marinum]|uniref:hypothetical protein n=1 Tax=Cysteiniphilum marinum TaxID=2774191 RepID=UPI00193A2704|nr:hypothetical protein [Cysteiniphilum marinum]
MGLLKKLFGEKRNVQSENRATNRKVTKAIKQSIQDVHDEPIKCVLSTTQIESLQRAKNKAQALRLQLKIDRLEYYAELLNDPKLTCSKKESLASDIIGKVEELLSLGHSLSTEEQTQKQSQAKVVGITHKKAPTGLGKANQNNTNTYVAARSM